MSWRERIKWLKATIHFSITLFDRGLQFVKSAPVPGKTYNKPLFKIGKWWVYWLN